MRIEESLNLSSSTRVEPSFSTSNPIRILPGPAGIVHQAKLFKENVFILDSDRALMSTQKYMQQIIEDVSEDDDFNSGAWVSATNYVKAFDGNATECLRDIDNFLKKEKLDQVVAIVKSCSPNVLGDLNVTMKDLSGTIPRIIHHKVIGEDGYEKDITVGAAMILSNVSVFTSKPSQHYLNITMKNVVEVKRSLNDGRAFTQQRSWAVLKTYPKWDAPEPVYPVGVTEHTELFEDDSRPRPPGKPHMQLTHRRGNQGDGAFQGSTFVHGASPSYGGAPPPQLAPPSSVFYPPYGYAAYSPEYAYHQAMYNSVMQYPYYGPTSNAMSAPYYYGYSPTQVPTPRGAISPQAQRAHPPSYMYYPTQQTGPSDYPTPPPRLVFVPPRQPGLQTPQDTAKETDDATVSSRPPNT
nr:RNA-binding (RRM/RBD/RNP motifs) family protein [Tanacetum cinerariifolium]